MALFDAHMEWGSKDKYSEERQLGIKLAFAAAFALVNLRVPIFFVAPDLFKAVQLTVPPVNLDWTSFQLPFSSAAFALPRSSLTHATHGEIGYIWYTRIAKGQFVPAFPGIDGHGLADDDYLVVMACCLEAPHRPCFSHILKAEHQPTLDLKALKEEALTPLQAEASIVEDSQHLLAAISTLLFGLLFAMNAREGLWHHGQRTGRSSKTGLEFWTPNIIGKDYVLRDSNTSSQAGASPRMHWRRGHMRQQPYGAANALRRSQWIEPTLVAAESGD